MDIKAYLEQEKRGGSEHRSEYIAGTLYELHPGNDNHFTIRLNFSFLLKEHLSRLEQCRIYISDMKVYIPTLEALLYPDIFVTCSDTDLQQNDYKQHPVMIIEIATANSGNFDRGHKFACYRHLDSLQAYIIVDAEREAVDCFERDSQQRWLLSAYSSEDNLHLNCLNFDCNIVDIYQDIFADD
jgi:Uma2 family endonuclease